MEAKQPPIVVPMWLTGFDRVMPEGRPFPYKYLPRFGTQISVSFGDPIPLEDLQGALSGREGEKATRISVTALVHDHVERLGRTVTGLVKKDA